MSSSREFSCRSAPKRGRPKGSLGPKARAIRCAVDDLTVDYDRMTVRQVFYKLETLSVVEKTEGGYRQVQAQVLRMRRDGLLAWGFITDGTRWMRKPQTWDEVDDFMAAVANTYRRNLWQDHDVRVEVWLEKDALADVITDVTRKWDVPLMVSRGQSSTTFLYNAAKQAEQAWNLAGVTSYVYALYDHDAGGQRAAQTIARELPQYAPGTPIVFEQIAVTEQQIRDWDLPTRPAKKTDPQAKTFGPVAVELDAIDPVRLISLVENAIQRHVDSHAWGVQQAVEAEERRGIHNLLSRTGEGEKP